MANQQNVNEREGLSQTRVRTHIANLRPVSPVRGSDNDKVAGMKRDKSLERMGFKNVHDTHDSPDINTGAKLIKGLCFFDNFSNSIPK